MTISMSRKSFCAQKLYLATLNVTYQRSIIFQTDFFKRRFAPTGLRDVGANRRVYPSANNVNHSVTKGF